jgi:hypothetical protein
VVPVLGEHHALPFLPRTDDLGGRGPVATDHDLRRRQRPRSRLHDLLRRGPQRPVGLQPDRRQLVVGARHQRHRRGALDQRLLRRQRHQRRGLDPGRHRSGRLGRQRPTDGRGPDAVHLAGRQLRLRRDLRRHRPELHQRQRHRRAGLGHQPDLQHRRDDDAERRQRRRPRRHGHLLPTARVQRQPALHPGRQRHVRARRHPRRRLWPDVRLVLRGVRHGGRTRRGELDHHLAEHRQRLHGARGHPRHVRAADGCGTARRPRRPRRRAAVHAAAGDADPRWLDDDVERLHQGLHRGGGRQRHRLHADFGGVAGVPADDVGAVARLRPDARRQRPDPVRGGGHQRLRDLERHLRLRDDVAEHVPVPVRPGDRQRDVGDRHVQHQRRPGRGRLLAGWRQPQSGQHGPVDGAALGHADLVGAGRPVRSTSARRAVRSSTPPGR